MPGIRLKHRNAPPGNIKKYTIPARVTIRHFKTADVCNPMRGTSGLTRYLNAEVNLLKLIRQMQESRFHNTNDKATEISPASQLLLRK